MVAAIAATRVAYYGNRGRVPDQGDGCHHKNCVVDPEQDREALQTTSRRSDFKMVVADKADRDRKIDSKVVDKLLNNKADKCLCHGLAVSYCNMSAVDDAMQTDIGVLAMDRSTKTCSTLREHNTLCKHHRHRLLRVHAALATAARSSSRPKATFGHPPHFQGQRRSLPRWGADSRARILASCGRLKTLKLDSIAGLTQEAFTQVMPGGALRLLRSCGSTTDQLKWQNRVEKRYKRQADAVDIQCSLIVATSTMELK